MLLPDNLCPIHREPWTLYDRGRYVQKRCLPCYRELQSPRHHGGSRCWRGHLKTPWTWRPNRSGVGYPRCITCQREGARDRRRARAAERSPRDTAHCRRGHPYDEVNTYLRPDGQRICRTCRREYETRMRTAA